MSDVMLPVALESLLKKTGPPERLEEAAEAMERLALTSDEATNERRLAAAKELRDTADAGRVALRELEEWGLQFHFDRGCAVLPSGGRGPRAKLLSAVIGVIFEDLDPQDWYTPATYKRIRRELAHLIHPEDLSDTLIRRTIERHVDRRR